MATGNYFSLEEVLEQIVSQAECPRVGFAISGGGATGAYEAGVIEAYLRLVKEKAAQDPRYAGAAPRIIVGTSAGALNAVAMLIDAVGLGLQDRRAVTHGFELWRAIGGKDEGARYVVGRRSWLVRLATQLLKRRWIRFAFTYLLPVTLAAAFNPVLCAAVLKAMGLFPGFTARVLDSAGWFAVLGAVSLMALAFALMEYFRRSAFANQALAATVANAVAPPPGEAMRVSLLRKADPAKKARQLVDAWHALPAPARPEFIVTGTDLTVRRDALFTLVSASTFARLAEQGWFALQLCDRKEAPPVDAAYRGVTGRIEPEKLIDCVIASTSIPGVFPSQRIALENGSGRIVSHEFVDGGVLNNAPVHIAIDAGATHVISLELNPLRGIPPADVQEWRDPPNLVDSAVQSFATLLDSSTTGDLRGATEWNRRLQKRGGQDQKKSVIQLFRVAPIEKRAVDVVDFNGHYEGGRAPPHPSLVQWAEQGLTEAATRHSFWDATFEGAPGTDEWPPEPKDCPRCAAKAAAQVAARPAGAPAAQPEPGVPAEAVRSRS